MNWRFVPAASLIAIMLTSFQASAEIFDGIDFPDGVSSFADTVLTYDCNFGGGLCPAAAYQDPTLALGNPDLNVPDPHFVSLGTFGLLEVAFVDNRLTNSGDALDDLHIFELGTDVEDTLVAVRPTAATALILGASFDANADGFYEVGSVAGGTSSVDIDSFFPGHASGVLVFDAVQLIDEFGQTGPTFGTHGADITAVGALSSALNPAVSIVDVIYDTPVIDFGPLSFGLAALPAEPEVTFLLGDGTPAGGGTSYGLADVLSATLIFGDVIGPNNVIGPNHFTAFAMEVDAGGVTTALSYAFAAPDTATVEGPVILNFPFTVTGTDIASGNAFSYTYDNSAATVTLILDGDLNADGFVGIADLNIVLGVWNTNVTPGDLLAGDPSGDGFVGIADLNVVLGNWNAGTPPGAPGEAANIPEPGTFAVLGLGLPVLLRRRVK
jgi:hypothetical protein